MVRVEHPSDSRAFLYPLFEYVRRYVAHLDWVPAALKASARRVSNRRSSARMSSTRSPRSAIPERLASNRLALENSASLKVTIAPPMANKTRSQTLDVFEKLAELALPATWPDPIIWLEQTRRLSPESSREVGPFLFSRASSLEEPQRAILSPVGGEVVVNWANQCGKSELLFNALLW